MLCGGAGCHESCCRSRHNILNHPRLLYAGEALIEALEGEGQAFVIDAEQVQHGRMKVADVDGVLDHVVAEVIRFVLGNAAGFQGQVFTKME